jgi:hypothetical protein
LKTLIKKILRASSSCLARLAARITPGRGGSACHTPHACHRLGIRHVPQPRAPGMLRRAVLLSTADVVEVVPLAVLAHQ